MISLKIQQPDWPPGSLQVFGGLAIFLSIPAGIYQLQQVSHPYQLTIPKPHQSIGFAIAQLCIARSVTHKL